MSTASQTPSARQGCLSNTVATERRLAAIMFTDIVGYTALMAEDKDRIVTRREFCKDASG